MRAAAFFNVLVVDGLRCFVMLSRCQSCRCLLAAYGTESMSGLQNFMLATICHSVLASMSPCAPALCVPSAWAAGGVVTDRVSWTEINPIANVYRIFVCHRRRWPKKKVPSTGRKPGSCAV